MCAELTKYDRQFNSTRAKFVMCHLCMTPGIFITMQGLGYNEEKNKIVMVTCVRPYILCFLHGPATSNKFGQKSY